MSCNCRFTPLIGYGDDYDIISYQYSFTESPAQLTLRGEPIAENLSDSNSIKVYRFTWDPPVNIEKIDVKHIEFKVDEQPPTILRNISTEILFTLSYGNHTVSIVAVDRCD